MGVDTLQTKLINRESQRKKVRKASAKIMTNKIKDFENKNWFNVEETNHFYNLTSKGSEITKNMTEAVMEFSKENNLEWFITTSLNDFDSWEAAIAIVKR